jgi:hypothetical protein
VAGNCSDLPARRVFKVTRAGKGIVLMGLVNCKGLVNPIDFLILSDENELN